MSWGSTIRRRTKMEEAVLMESGEVVAVFDSDGLALAHRVMNLLNGDDAARREAERKAEIAASAKGEAVVAEYPAARPEYWGVFIVKGGPVMPDAPTTTHVYTDDGLEARAERTAASYNDS